jgi:murein L,D-transpeptidase YafK
MVRFFGVLAFLFASILGVSSFYRQVRASPGARVRAGMSLRAACQEAGGAFPPRPLELRIRKSARVLAAYSGSRLLKEYPVALGPAPAGDKVRQGDARTPVGRFYICTRLEQSRFRRFLGISYPRPADAQRGLRAGWISHRQHDAIRQAHGARRQPPWNTPLGGAVGIHGGGIGSDWTLGCVALENPAIDELFAVARLGTPVTISE